MASPIKVASPLPASPGSPLSAQGLMSTAGKPPVSVKEALDILLFGELNSAQVKKLVFELSGIITNFSDFAEEFLDRAGLQLIVDLVKKASGSNIQGHLLFVLKALLNYVNAIEAVKEQPELVDKIYYLLAPQNSDSNSNNNHGAPPVNLTVAKATLEVLIVLCHVLPDGRELIHDAAKRRAGPEQKPYAILAPYIGCSDLLCVRNCLLFMNVLLKKARDESEHEGKDLVFRWKESGLTNLLKPLTAVEDPLVKQQLATFQKLSDLVIPGSWGAAEKYRIMYEDMKKRYESANESIFVFQQQQAKIRLMKMEFQRATETLKLMGMALPDGSRRPHPVRRFEHGGGLNIKELGSTQMVDVEINQDTVKETTSLRKSLLEKFLTSVDIRAMAEKTLGVMGGGGHGHHGRHGKRIGGTYFDPASYLHNDDPPPPTDSDSDGGLPSDDSDGDLPPSDDDGDGPPRRGGGGGKRPGGKPPKGGAGARRGGGGPPSGPPSDDDSFPDDDDFPDDDEAPPGGNKKIGGGLKIKDSAAAAGGGNAAALVAIRQAALASYTSENDALAAQTIAQSTALQNGMDPTAAMKLAREIVAALKAGTLTAESIQQEQQAAGGGATAASSTGAATTPSTTAATAGTTPAAGTTATPATATTPATTTAVSTPATTAAATPAPVAAKLPAGKMPGLPGKMPGLPGKMPPLGGKGKGLVKDEKQWYKGNPPSKKMRPLHWDKIAMADVADGTIWKKIHDDSMDKTFDFDEFETMFSQKEVVKEEKKEKKKEELMLVDPKTFMNFSIMLHKLPPIPTIQRAILELDNQTLKKDQIQALLNAAEPKSLPPDTVKEFRTKQDLKPVAEYNGPEQFVAMVLSMGDVFKPRLAAWTFTLSWKDSMDTLRAPLTRASVVMDSVLTSQHLPYYLAILLGFGNVMNHGSAKGNAPAIMLSVLGKIDATKDNRGKTSLMQHLLNTVRQRNPQALELAEELKCIWKEQGGGNGLKLDDLEKSVSEAEGAVTQFNNHINAVKRLNADNPMAGSDPFVPTMTQFLTGAQSELEDAKKLLEEAKKRYKEMVKYFGYPEKRAPKLEEMMNELVNFVAKVRKVSDDAAKDKKKLAQKGKKLDGKGIDGVVGQLQEALVHS